MLLVGSISLHPDSPEVILLGGPNQASSGYITGRVVVVSKNIDQLKSLIVTLRPQRQRLFQTQSLLTPPLLLQTALVTDGQSEQQVINNIISGKGREWRFSIEIPGSTAETIFSKEHVVAYELVADARTYGSFANASQSKACSIMIKRTPSTDSLWTMQASAPITETVVWRSKLELTIFTNSRIIHDEEVISVRGTIRPLEKGMSMAYAGFQIFERITREVAVRGSLESVEYNEVVTNSTVDIHSIYSAMHNDISGGGSSIGIGRRSISNYRSMGSNSIPEKADLPLVQEISIPCTLTVPEIYTGIQYDIHRGPIKSSHELILFIAITDDQGNPQSLRLSTPMFVLPKVVGKQANLPRYEDTDMDQLVETSSDCNVERDVDFWSNFVFVDSILESEDGTLPQNGINESTAAAESNSTDDCPLALEGYQALSANDVPPPSYPGAANTIDRTVVSASMATPVQAFTRTHRVRRICSRTLLRSSSVSSTSSLPARLENRGNSGTTCNEFVFV
ncbi:hypothetical protein LPJ66_005838 [Kickxella alabastrina]|uniref:Uncharacterized protein n=1 Tax=Kickxella alabastrina TaxID=61397 RepID=A0ACC1ILS2_9FUNG|nr:hypothetical protein LPJ66_005838 [Kickxella alabastrina]